MKRLVFTVFATGLAAVMVVGVGSAAKQKKGVTPTAEANSYLARGVTPAVNNWLWPGGDESNSGYSQLKQINSSNVSKLKVAWNAQFNAATITNSPQSQPICCANNLMYLTARTGVIAIDPANGNIKWQYSGPAYNTVVSATNQVTGARSETYNPKLNYIYSGQQDGSVVALKATTGQPVWTVQVSGTGTYGGATHSESEPFTQYYDDGGDGIILSAPNGGESPFRGHVDAYNAKTGALVWRSWTTPDPTQFPYILTWSNPAEAATGGAAVWSIPSVDPQLGTVFFGTGNLYPWTGRQPGKDLFGNSIMAVDWKTGALKWYYQGIHHDIWDLDFPHPTQVLRVPINGKVTPLLVEGGKDGYFYVLNARNGGSVPNFKITEEPTYDPTGQGEALNGLYKSQPIPQGAAGCMSIVDYTAAGLAKCGFPADTLATEYGGTNNVNVQPNGSLINAADGKPIVGTTFAAAHTSAAYFVFGGGAGGGVFGYPRSSYDPNTHTIYACEQNQSGGHSNQGNSPNSASVSALRTQGIQAFYSAINLTNNKMLWQYRSMANTTGNCYSGSLSTAGNLSFTSFNGRTDISAAAAIAAGTPIGGEFDAFDSKTGKILWKWTGPGLTFGGPAISYMYKGKQYIAIYHGVAAPGQPGATATGQRDQLTVFTL